jgi:hypothetical protein
VSSLTEEARVLVEQARAERYPASSTETRYRLDVARTLVLVSIAESLEKIAGAVDAFNAPRLNQLADNALVAVSEAADAVVRGQQR